MYIILYHIISYYIILYYSISYYIILYCIKLYYIILYYIILYCIILYYIILYIILYYIMLYHIILYCIILYYIYIYMSLGGWRLPGTPCETAICCCFCACFSHTASMQNIDINMTCFSWHFCAYLRRCQNHLLKRILKISSIICSVSRR